MSTEKQFAVLGLGRFGQAIVKTLSDHGCDVLAIDKKSDIVNDVSSYATHVIQTDITDYKAMEEIGLGNFDVVIVAVGQGLEASIMATLFAKEKGCYVLAKANNHMQKIILEKLGADRIVLPEREMGEKIALNLLTHNIIDIINVSDEFSILEIHPIQKWFGHSIRNSNIRAKYGLNILALRRNKEILISPKPDEIIQENDILVVVGENNDLRRLTSKI